jgi:hypothetical protein
MSSNLDAARESRRAALVALRDTLARAMDDADLNMLPQIAGQYRATLADLDALADESPIESPAQRLRRERKEQRSTLKLA